MYMTTETDLLRTMETAWLHCAPGGLALFVPDCVRETFATAVAETEVSGEDDQERGLRCLSWTFDPDPADTTYSVHFAFMLREGASVTVSTGTPLGCSDARIGCASCGRPASRRAA
jgi:hypothetical protein